MTSAVSVTSVFVADAAPYRGGKKERTPSLNTSRVRVGTESSLVLVGHRGPPIGPFVSDCGPIRSPEVCLASQIQRSKVRRENKGFRGQRPQNLSTDANELQKRVSSDLS